MAGYFLNNPRNPWIFFLKDTDSPLIACRILIVEDVPEYGSLSMDSQPYLEANVPNFYPGLNSNNWRGRMSKFQAKPDHVVGEARKVHHYIQI